MTDGGLNLNLRLSIIFFNCGIRINQELEQYFSSFQPEKGSVHWLISVKPPIRKSFTLGCSFKGKTTRYTVENYKK